MLVCPVRCVCVSKGGLSLGGLYFLDKKEKVTESHDEWSHGSPVGGHWLKLKHRGESDFTPSLTLSFSHMHTGMHKSFVIKRNSF